MKYTVNTIKKITIIACLAMFIIGNVNAKSVKVPKIYAFGISTSFNDSTVFITNIQEIENAWINSKNKFLLDRNEYAYQLKNYFNSKNMLNRTCSIIFALNKKNIDKKFKNIKKKYLGNKDYLLNVVKPSDFTFTTITPDESELELTERIVKEKKKKNKKTQNKKQNKLHENQGERK